MWGELELTRIVIEPPDELISINAETRTSVTWHFVGYSEDQLIDLLNNAALPVNLQARLLDHQSWERRADRLLLRVPKDLILALPMESRRVLYAALSPFAENGGQWAPASFRANSAADWFAGSGLTDRTVSLVQPLLYRRGAALLFSDLDLILADIKTQRQRMLLLRTLARSTAQLAKLRIRPDTDLSAVIDYWSVGQARRAIAPLLKSLPRDEDGFAIDLVHLLPPAARRLVYTYDAPPPPGEESFRDCHWTALNFANNELDDRYRDIAAVRAAYATNYITVTDEPRLGDIYLFLTEGGTVLHASVHIAGDLVFTKNGAWAAAPWVLMRMSDLVDLYPSDEPLEIRHLRRRE
ncbi:hypothetical protein [Actomonas aquatica]|uniref:NlpC/P60 domain-containing protein n=1 Tax=Actomonas aquatica TaxID=2866162 RepID=A0ABZ1CAJ2_9BACT|nr:hypothetical protein [Opitutus sp. WL0086]WRQ88693.1 hypothetical protein K1X11_004705 [Opitutus sp. WL0086]